MKKIKFIGASLKDLKKFPEPARKQAGFQLRKVQEGKDPSDWKPMSSVGLGVREIRIHSEGEHRVIYVGRMKNVVYVLHAFRKKSRETRKKDIDISKRRYKIIGGVS